MSRRKTIFRPGVLIGWTVLSLVALNFAAGPALAQLTPEQERTTAPSRQGRDLQPGLTPRAVSPILVPEIPRPPPPPGAEQISFVLKEVLLEGNKVFSAQQLKPQWAQLLGKTISLTDAYKIAADITVHYRNQGYILSRAILPPQEIVNGVVEIELVEGYIDSVVIEGELTGAKFQIEEKIKAIKASRPLHSSVIERYMLLINDLPGVSATSLLRPSPTAQGASELVIVVEETPVNASVSFDNRGTRFVGSLQQIATVNLANILGLYDATEIRLIRAQGLDLISHRELRAGSIKHTQLLTSEGTSLELSAARTLTSPGSTLADLNVRGRATFGSVLLTHPVVRSRRENLSLQLGFNYLNSYVRTGPGGAVSTLSDDRTRWLRAIVTSDFVDQFRGINLLRLEIQHGLDILGAAGTGSENPSRENGRADFTKINFDFVRDQDLGVGFSLFGAITGQYAFHQLLTSHEFGFGGRVFGRGYDPSEIAGDHGAAGKLELRYGSESDLDFLETYQLFGFADYGAVWRIDSRRLTGGARDSAASAGVGVRLNFTQNIFGSFSIAKPLTRDPAISRDDGKKSPRWFFSITARL